jgi:hypothetical protein
LFTLVRIPGKNRGVNFHRPALFEGHEFAVFEGAADPAEVSALAHETASLLLAHVKNAPAEVVDRAIELTDENGLDIAAELWSKTSAHSLPGSLWRMYLVRAYIRQQPEYTSDVYTRGVAKLSTADAMIAGAATPTGPEEIRALADQILRGAFAGDFGLALSRTASFCRVSAAGCLALADDYDVISHKENVDFLTTQAATLTKTATELANCARAWRSGSLT